MIFKPKKTDSLTKEMESIVTKMSQLEPNTDEYTAMAKNLATLYDAKSKVKDRKISWDPIVTGAFSLLGILIIVLHEDVNVITSKALGLVVKGRV